MAALIILIVTLIVSIIGLSSPSFIARSLLLPYRVARGSGYAGLITSGFVHADITHMLFNLITYYFFAFRLESVIGSTMFEQDRERYGANVGIQFRPSDELVVLK